MNKRNQRIIQKVTTFLTLALFVTAAMTLAAKARKSSANTNSTSASSANMVSQTPTYRFRHKVSKGNLAQYDMGTTNRLEATVWPEDNADGVKWILQDAGNGYTFFINKESGLVLSVNADNPKNNYVGLWPRLTPNHDGQLWKMQKAPSGDYMITNKARGTGLGQYDGGKSNRREATVWPGQTFDDPGFLWSMEPAGNADMLKLTIQEVKCIAPSTGQDAGTSALFAGLGAAIAVAVTAATAGAATPITAGMVASAVAAGAGKGTAAKAIFGDKLAGRDDLMIKVNGRKVWPADRNDMPIDSQQTIAVNSQYIYESSRGANLELWEYDSGSADDNLGSSMMKGVRLPYEEELVIANKSEGSFYQVKVKVESLNPDQPSPTGPTNAVGTLNVGAILRINEYVVSPSKNAFAIMQDDGNLAVYRGSGPSDKGAFVWGSVQVGGYAPKQGSYYAVMQDDGNLAVYHGSGPSDKGAFVWGSVQDGGYAPKQGSYYAVMQDDGNLVVYHGSGPSDKGAFVWGSVQSLGRKK